jgi:hypothetical protein
MRGLKYVPGRDKCREVQMLPTKSKLRYQKKLEKFTQWQTEKRIRGIDENVMMAYQHVQGIQC